MLDIFKQCPKCGQTARKVYQTSNQNDLSVVSCIFCHQKYAEYENIWYSMDGEIVQSEYDPIIDALHELSEDTYNVPVMYLTDVERKVLGIKHSSFIIVSEDEKLVAIKGNVPDLERIVALAHEIGHIVDFTNTYQADIDLWACDNAIIEKEKAAWRKAAEILLDLEFGQWDVFLFYVRTWFGTYTGNVEVNRFINELLAEKFFERVPT